MRIMSMSLWRRAGAGLLLAFMLLACAPSSTGITATSTPVPAPSPMPSATPAPGATTYTAPFAYCKAVGTIDAPGPDYSGSPMPEALAQALKKASGAAADTPISLFENGGFWRCMDGQVYGCFVGANLPCQDKANTDRTPTDAESAYCRENPNSDFIPAAVTGHNTVYEWRCTDGKAEVVKQVFQVDQQGYIADFWYPLSPP